MAVTYTFFIIRGGWQFKLANVMLDVVKSPANFVQRDISDSHVTLIKKILAINFFENKKFKKYFFKIKI